MDYFRAIVKSGEISDRVFRLTIIVIENLPSNYNAYFVRRKCLFQLNLDLKEELQFMSELTLKNEKVYQIWEHRRQLIERINDPNGEIEFLHKILDSDNKNYHVWSYRVWLCEKFNLYEQELFDNEYYITEDVGNNSAWNYRYFLLSKMKTDFTTELEFIKKAIRIKQDNEASWNYLRGWFKMFQFPHDTENPYKTFVQYSMDNNIIEFLNEVGDNNRFAMSLRMQCHCLNKEFDKAIELCDRLKVIDGIRENYWQYMKNQIGQLIN